MEISRQQGDIVEQTWDIVTLAEWMGYSTEYMRVLVHRHKIPRLPGGKMRFLPSAVMRWAEDNMVDGTVNRRQ